LSITSKILLIKNLDRETENKATLVGSTALVIMFLLNKENIKNQVRLLPVYFKFSMFINATNYISILSMNHLSIVFAT